jgi:hypothetical protein
MFNSDGHVVGHSRIVEGLEFDRYLKPEIMVDIQADIYPQYGDTPRVCETNRIAMDKALRGSLAFSHLAFASIYYATAMKYEVAFATTRPKLARVFAQRYGTHRTHRIVKYDENDPGMELICYPLGLPSLVSRVLFAVKWHVRNCYSMLLKL